MAFVFSEKYSYQYLPILKRFGGKFDKNKMSWELPMDCKKEFLKEKSEIDFEQKQRAKKVWEMACTRLGFDFVKKDTEDYDKVRELFKELIKEEK